ncbi:tail fiber domain-containing protein [Serratia marcescens]|uniref:tail fiber domain-containing protein n=1 Tax=Serratia marcescens TaxID=615 RepID=UPI001570AEB2|nr:tail fiber domain-containing protein [Serratia marcescens]NSL16547.1 tail fiber domain-containing protein [Serratia marcescens]
MSMYEIGTITGAAGTRVINGSGTQWANNLYGVSVGSVLMIYGAGTVDAYQITKVVSNTQVEVSRALAKAVSNVSYGIITSETASTASFSNQLIETMDYYRRNVLAWQKIITETGDVTITAPDGTTVTVPSMKGIRAELDKKANTADLGNSSNRNVGSTAGTVAAGDDSRLNSVSNKSGGRLQGGLGVLNGSAGVDLRNAGTYLLWNEQLGTGISSIVNNPEGGAGGLWIRLINSTNTVERARFTFSPDSTMIVPQGVYTVNGRVRSFTSVAPSYLEVIVDGKPKGINFFDSDEKIKENIKPVENGKALYVISKLRPVSYKFKDTTYEGGVTTGATHDFGVIAQEVERILPNGVITMSDGKKSLNPLELFGLLLTAQKELLEKVDNLKEQLSEIKNNQ